MTVHEPGSTAAPGFTVAAVVLRDAHGRVLVVRKHGTEAFMLPGGKIEPGEPSWRTAVREIAEEVRLKLTREHLRFLGAFRSDAANEPGHYVQADVFECTHPVAGATPDAEIAELRWLDLAEPWPVPVAPLLVDLVSVIAPASGREHAR